MDAFESGEKCLLLLLATALLLGLLDHLEGGGGLEAERGRSGDLHRLTGLRVTAHAGSAALHLKGTETNELHLLLADGFTDGVKHGGESSLSALTGGTLTELGLDAVDKLALVHRPL